VTKVALGLSDPAGRNVSEAWAGLESVNTDADPRAIWGRSCERGSTGPAARHSAGLTEYVYERVRCASNACL
jgi:hypothetical protein